MFDNLEVVVENATELSRTDQNAFRLIRRNGLGASDSSIILGVNPYPNGTIGALVQQKNSFEPTPDEIRVGEMPTVRMGSDCEPIILRAFEEDFGLDVIKPDAMYRFKLYPHITINFDGIVTSEGVNHGVPVEAKLISMYGGKYYNFEKAINPGDPEPLVPWSDKVNLQEYIKDMAEQTGIPVYYYTQIQQQMMGLDADFGFLTTKYVKDWKRYTWIVYRDDRVWNELPIYAYKAWNQVIDARKI